MLTSLWLPAPLTETELFLNIARQGLQMKSADLQRLMTERLGSRSASDIDQRCRRLRKVTSEFAGLLTSKRGAGASELTFASAVVHLMAMVSQRPADSAKVAIALATSCRLVRHPIVPVEMTLLAGGFPLMGAIMAAMAMDERLLSWEKFEITEDGRFGWLQQRRDPSVTTFRYLFTVDYDRFLAPAENVVLAGEDPIPEDGKWDLLRRYEAADLDECGPRFVFSCEFLAEVGRAVGRDLPPLDDAK